MMVQQLPTREFGINVLEFNTCGFKNCRLNLGDLEELTRSIVTDGLWHDPVVHLHVDAEGIEHPVVIDGNRRVHAILAYRETLTEAAREEWFKTITCKTHTGNKEEAMALSIGANLHQLDLNPADKAESVAKLYEQIGTQIDTANLLNLSQGYVSYLCSVYYQLCKKAFQAYREGILKPKQVSTLMKLILRDKTPDVPAQEALLQKFLDGSANEPKIKEMRTRKEVETLRKQLENNELDHDLSTEAVVTLERLFQWYFMEAELDEAFDIYVKTEDPEEED